METAASSTGAAPVRWPDEVDAVIRGDLTAAAAYVTAAGGAVVTAVAPCGLAERSRGVVGFTTSLGFPQKLRRIVRDPHVSLAFHAREHGFADSPRFVLVQGFATVDLTPSRTRLESLMPQTERFMGEPRRGPLWDRLLHEYYWERVFIDIAVVRIVSWPDLSATGEPEVYGAPRPPAPPPQAPPELGVAPRVDVARLTGSRRAPESVAGMAPGRAFPVPGRLRAMLRTKPGNDAIHPALAAPWSRHTAGLGQPPSADD